MNYKTILFILIIAILIVSCKPISDDGANTNSSILITKAEDYLAKHGVYWCYSVDQIWNDPYKFIGKQICVVGTVEHGTISTLLLCIPFSCTCNEKKGWFHLFSEPDNSRGLWEGEYISLEFIDCHGGECCLTCSPIDPYGIGYVKLVGKLNATYHNGEPKDLSLVEVDLSRSRRLDDREWRQIPVGTFPVKLTSIYYCGVPDLD